MNNYYNCIYMYINNINGHKYVGQAIDFNRRHRQHISASYNKNNGQYNTHFHCAIRKYGEENFDIVILKENLSSQCLLNLYECYYIDKYKCLSKENYNIASGGSNGNVFEGKTEEEMDIIRKNMSNSWKNKTDEEKNKYRYKQKKVSYDLYNTTEFWNDLLIINNFFSLSEFQPGETLKVYDPNKLKDYINEIMINEKLV